MSDPRRDTRIEWARLGQPNDHPPAARSIVTQHPWTGSIGSPAAGISGLAIRRLDSFLHEIELNRSGLPNWIIGGRTKFNDSSVDV